MATTTTYSDLPLVSVVIPCFNHANYLPKAIKSVLNQTYHNIEIMVVDDGSVDNTESVAALYQEANYIYQSNKGLSAARNTGIKNSKGDYIMFLDADDWIYPKGIEWNVTNLKLNSEAAFVSGTFNAVFVDQNLILEKAQEVTENHYIQLLKGNYIGMVSTVMFRRFVFDEFQFDETLKNCEDYDMYLKVARKYPVFHHKHKIAAYRFHATNMSGNLPVMLKGVLNILERQQPDLKTESEKTAYQTGRRIWKNYYCKEMYQKLLWNKIQVSKEIIRAFLKNKPAYYLKYLYNCKGVQIKKKLHKFIPDLGQRLLHKIGLHERYVPATGKINKGDFSRTSPFSYDFGDDRGGALDRYYIEKFLNKEALTIKGRTLEIGDNQYTTNFGKDRVTQSDILHIDDSNKAATFVGDISHAPHIPDNLFDCIILTQTLHLIYDFKEALNTCHRILKPGGTLLLTVPGITQIDGGQWNHIWYWSFTDRAIKRAMAESFPQSDIEVNTFGNVLAASAFLYGMGLGEIPKENLDYHDPLYQVIIAAKAQKSAQL